MTLRQFIFNNVFRNKRLYVAYFLSSLFTVMIFFTFLNFAFHPTISGSQMNEHVKTGLFVAGGIIYLFSFFFILYSMSNFLHARKREFGVFMIHGMSDMQLRYVVLLENMLIGFFATVIGMSFGVIFSKAILLIAENVLPIERLDFYFPWQAILMTFVSFICLFFIISIFIMFVIRTERIMTLIKGEKIAKKEPKASIVLTIVAALCLAVGYTIALIVERVDVIFALVPVSILVIIGTYFLFTQLNVYVVNKLRQKPHLYWKNTNILLFSDLANRMKDNARTFFLVAIISTVVFSAIGTLVGLQSYLTVGAKEANPIPFLYSGDDAAEIEAMEQILTGHGLTYEKEEIELAYFMQNDELVLVTTPETYNKFARLAGEEEIQLRGSQAITVEQSSTNLLVLKENLADYPLTLKDDTVVFVTEELQGIAKANVLPVLFPYYIVSEEIFSYLPEAERVDPYVGWQVTSGTEQAILDAGEEAIDATLPVTAVDFIVQMMYTMYSPVMFVGLFVGIVFFVAAGSFLYFRLYNDLDADKRKFRMIHKIGLTKDELNKIISQQMFLLFFVPIIVAIIHGAIALTALSHFFTYSIVKESALVLGSFFVIQVIYFVVVRYFYTKEIEKAL